MANVKLFFLYDKEVEVVVGSDADIEDNVHENCGRIENEEDGVKDELVIKTSGH